MAETEQGQGQEPAKVVIGFDVVQFYCYSTAQIAGYPVRELSIANQTDDDLRDVEVIVDSATDMLTDQTFHLDVIPAHSAFEADCSKIKVDLQKLLQLTELVTDDLKLTITVHGEQVFEDVREITLFAFDQWSGEPALLASFVTPNDPSLSHVIINASKYLKEWTGSSAFDEYQSDDPHRVRLQAAALYRALKEENVHYISAPASFGPGQRIRMVSSVLSDHLATCLDFSLAYASLLEAVGIRPLILLFEGHALPGFWMTRESFPEAIVEDVTALINRYAKGADKISICEATTLASDNKSDFEQAELAAHALLEGGARAFECAVDIHTARTSAILPLPSRIKGDQGWEIDPGQLDLGEAVAPEAHGTSRRVLDVAATAHVKKTKKQLWERSLLDLSMNNNLLNMKPGRRVLPILTPSIDRLEDLLAKDNDIVIMSRPQGLKLDDEKEAFGIVVAEGSLAKALDAELEEGRLRTLFNQVNLDKNLKNLYRSAKSSMEETGANTLFLTLGTLSWIDEKRSGQHRFSPIMLVPIDIVRKSAKTGYIMRLRDDDPQINISLVEMLRADYDISLDGLDPLPLDEAGVDTRLVLNTVRDRIADQPGWEVLETATVGLFSFSQFVMWNDIHNREEDLRKSKIVDSLMEGHLTWQPKELNPDEPVDPSRFLLPVEADASQLYAIQEAIEGNSFVLHGPPGTGKSQTITAIIANALVRGQKVLFVAEKMAALEVVEKRLAALGLEPFCLEVHSTKATKNHVLDQIQAASQVSASQHGDRYAQKAAEVQRLRQRLDRYANNLRARNQAGITLRDQICLYENLRAQVEPMAVSRDLIDSIAGPDDFSHRMNVAELLVNEAEPLAPTGSSPLSAVKGSDFTQELKFKLPTVLDAYRDALIALEANVEQLCAALGLPRPASLADCIQLANDAAGIRRYAHLPDSWLALDNLAGMLDDLSRLLAANGSLKQLHYALSTRYSESFFSADLMGLQNEWAQASSKGIGRGRAVKRFLAKVAMYSKTPLGEEDLSEFFDALAQFKRRSEAFESLMSALSPYVSGFLQVDGQVRWDKVHEAIDQARALVTAQASAGVSQQLVSRAMQPEARQAIEAYLAGYTTMVAARHEVEALIGKLPDAEDPDWFGNQRQLCADIAAHVDELHDRMAWNKLAAQARELRLDDLLDALETKPVTPDTFKSFTCGVYQTMCITSMDSLEGVNSFSGNRFDELVGQYSRADKQLRELAQKEIYYRVAERTPNLTLESVKSTSAATLQKALRSRGRNVSIRSVFRDCADTVFALCPCLLMSPLSVAQYLEPGSGQFDLLIFDEASQLQTCKAIGALSRAQNAVIVGDPRQMPPTSFFQGKVEGEDFEEVGDLESILEDCLALNMPQTYLKWHYRSQHESLIAFSNKRFYENRMLTFPSVDDRESRVAFRRVEGFFDRGGSRTNEAEAKAIVSELKRRAVDPVLRTHSVGIVTFNISQQQLIDDLFQHACEQDQSLFEWAYNEDEPLFIKNLENVQGDERDVILFSITYGPDKTGKMSMNFGPINREGGWRRLNVAVTRARMGMQVFSTMEPSDIDLSHTTSAGPASLKAFLEYAQRGTFGLVTQDEMEQSARSDQIADEICARLSEAGYTVKRNVGRSSYRVDIGVVDPKDPGRYLAGILLDGATYELAKSTRDREIAQPDLLKRLGWHVFRVWTMDWWEDREGTCQRLLQFLKETDEELGERSASPAKPEVGEEAELELEPVAEPEPGAGLESAAGPEPVAEPESQLEAPASSALGPLPAEPPEASVASMPSELVIEPAPLNVPAPALVETLAGQQAVVAAAGTAPESGLKPAEKQGPQTAAEPATAGPEVPAPQPESAPGVAAPKEQSSVHDDGAGLRLTYAVASLPQEPLSTDEFMELDDADIAAKLDAVLEVESPIEISLLYRRVTRSHDIGRMSARIQGKLDSAFKKCSGHKVSQAGRTMVWRKGQDNMQYCHYRVTDNDDERRTVDQLPLEEIAAAAADVLSGGAEMGQEELYRATANQLGYVRMTSNVRDYMKKGVSLGVRRGWLARG